MPLPADEEEEESLPEARRREIFLALVEAQDRAMTVAESRRFICERYKVSDDLLREIEQEGLDRQWPPL
jgi:hypothetical protein